ncbi:MAG: hypothetical protein HC942_29855 [Microcoleus sp. SU_5_6]|nr:hypothetical protein [Microcoleus sp. SU_5_6]
MFAREKIDSDREILRQQLAISQAIVGRAEQRQIQATKSEILQQAEAQKTGMRTRASLEVFAVEAENAKSVAIAHQFPEYAKHLIEQQKQQEKESRDREKEGSSQQPGQQPGMSERSSSLGERDITDREPNYAEQAIRSANPNLKFYDFKDLADDAAGIIIAGPTGYGKTSTACHIAGNLTENAPAQVFALDPHYNDIWEQVGIHAIGEFDEIEEVINLLVEELDKRRRRKKNKQPIGETIICFTDELNACLSNCENEESIKNALKRLGSEGRKFGIILIAINQSSNVDDIGISGPYRANFLMILLGASARSISERTWKATDDRAQWIEKQVYACCVAGCVAPQVAIHPTHGTYGKFRKRATRP